MRLGRVSLAVNLGLEKFMFSRSNKTQSNLGLVASHDLLGLLRFAYQ